MKEKTELAEEKQAYFDYKDAISSEYIGDYIKRSRGKRLVQRSIYIRKLSRARPR